MPSLLSSTLQTLFAASWTAALQVLFEPVLLFEQVLASEPKEFLSSPSRH
jgi:hypothetical protein